MEDALSIDFMWKLLLFAGAAEGNKEELLKEMAGMINTQEDFRGAEGCAGGVSKELNSASKVSGLAHGHRHTN